MVKSRRYICSAEAAAGASPPATEIMCGPDTFSNLPGDEGGKKKKGEGLFC